MGEAATYMVEKDMGCGLMGALFYRGGGGTTKVKKPPPVLPPLPAIKTISPVKNPGNYGPKRRRSSSSELKFLEMAKSTKQPSPKTGKPPTPTPTPTPTPKSTLISPRPSTTRPRPSLDSTQPKDLKPNKPNKESSQLINTPYTRKLRKEPTFTESELSMRVSVRKMSTSNGTLYRASSGNAMVIGHLGNLNQTGHVKTSDYRLPQKKENTEEKVTNGRRSLQLGNIYGGNLANKMDPEVFKTMGNEKYKQGKFEEALSLYNEAIGMDGTKASYYSNRSAALIGLGRLLEAIFDCRVAIRIEPSYHRAHYRLATLYLRLGEAEKAVCHYKCSGSKAETKDILQAQALKIQVGKCIEARKLRDWNTLLRESHAAVHIGADSAPQIYAMQAEALLNLHRHQEAYSATQKGPNFDVNICTQLFGSAVTANLLTIRAQAYMAHGRFEEAVTAAQRATDLDPRDEVKKLAKRVKAVAVARSNGNHVFKECKFSEACIAYSEGLEYEPYNSVLLCNRAACRYKLAQFEKAVEDCTVAINLRPSYAKARLRRAGCYVKLERWEAAIQDYEVLIQETLGNEEVEIALVEARIQLKKQYIEDAKAIKSVSNLVNITGKEHYRRYVLSPGISVVLFYAKTCHDQALQLMEQTCSRFSSVNFLKVEIEEHPHLAELEDLDCSPAFKIYKNGSTVKEIPGDNTELLESTISTAVQELTQEKVDKRKATTHLREEGSPPGEGKH